MIFFCLFQYKNLLLSVETDNRVNKQTKNRTKQNKTPPTPKPEENNMQFLLHGEEIICQEGP